MSDWLRIIATTCFGVALVGGFVAAGVRLMWNAGANPERAVASVVEDWRRCRREGRPFVYRRRSQWPIGVVIVAFDLGLLTWVVDLVRGDRLRVDHCVVLGVIGLISLLLLVAFPPWPRTAVQVARGEVTLRMIAATRVPVAAVRGVQHRLTEGYGEGGRTSFLHVDADGMPTMPGSFLLRPTKVVAAELDAVMRLERGIWR